MMVITNEIIIMIIMAMVIIKTIATLIVIVVMAVIDIIRPFKDNEVSVAKVKFGLLRDGGIVYI